MSPLRAFANALLAAAAASLARRNETVTLRVTVKQNEHEVARAFFDDNPTHDRVVIENEIGTYTYKREHFTS